MRRRRSLQRRSMTRRRRRRYHHLSHSHTHTHTHTHAHTHTRTSFHTHTRSHSPSQHTRAPITPTTTLMERTTRLILSMRVDTRMCSSNVHRVCFCVFTGYRIWSRKIHNWALKPDKKLWRVQSVLYCMRCTRHTHKPDICTCTAHTDMFCARTSPGCIFLSPLGSARDLQAWLQHSECGRRRRHRRGR